MWYYKVTIHGLFEIRFWFVVLACKKQVLISNEACEAGTPLTASEISVNCLSDSAEGKPHAHNR